MIIMRKRRKLAEIPDKFYEAVSQFVPSKEETPLKMVSGVMYYPKDNEERPRGEDAYFICAEQQTFGLADGVGGWAKKGIDAGEYARELMTNASISVLKEVESGEVNPLTVLTEAYSNTKAQGSSTACIVTLKDNYLYAANVGDSGFFVFRKGELVYESPLQQHRFNRPYQLGNSAKSDRPSSAEEIKVKVEDGDIVVAGTDGLLDNMFASEIKEVLAQDVKDVVIIPWRLAYILANYAMCNSFGYMETPFSKNAKRERLEHKGGKIDDITVIVSHIITV